MSRFRELRSVATLAAFFLLALTAIVPGQQPPQPIFRSGVEVVEVAAVVADRDGRPVRGLGTLHFDTPGGINPVEIVLTLMLTDAKGQILDVVTDRPFRSAQPLPVHAPWPFEVRSSMPISKPVRDVKVWVSASP